MQLHDNSADDPDQGADLRTLREQRGLSQTAVATFIGSQQVAVSSWEGGYIEVPEDKRPGLQQLFHVTEEELQAAIRRSQEQWEQEKDSRFGTHLAHLRAKHGVSRQMVAESADVTTGAVTWWESGVSHPTRVRLQAIAELFECKPRQLLIDAGWSTDEIDRYLEPPSQERNPVAVLLRSARQEAGLNQTQVAAAIGAVQNSVSALELGHYLPNAATWSKLIDLYGLDPTDAAVARYQARRDAGNYPEVALPWPLDPHEVPRPRWFRQLRAHLALDRGELADRIGVDRHVMERVEQPERDLPRQLRAPAALRELAAASMSSELALRQAWQGEEIAGVEHLVGLEGEELVAAARSATEVLRILAASGVSLTEMGDACGVTREAVRQWVAGNTRPRATAFAGLSELLGVEGLQLEELRASEESSPPQPADHTDPKPPPGPADRIFSMLPDQQG